MSKIIICPHCNERINLNKISKVSGKKINSVDFFDIEEEKEISRLLREKNIEFGIKPKRKEDG